MPIMIDFRSMRVLLLCALLCLALAVTAPNYNYSFRINFDESYIQNQTTYRINGQTFYDPGNNRERVDRTNGRYNLFCGSILPNVTTSCQSYTVSNKRWIVFPQRQQCCFCCDSSHGCGILRPDWLRDAEYKGQEKIVDFVYDKWSKDGDFGYNYFWTTANDAQIPRRLNENGDHITDYQPFTFHNQTIPFEESIFALPSYCNVDTPSNCPLESICGKLRSGQQ